jgi:hypothetical protein
MGAIEKMKVRVGGDVILRPVDRIENGVKIPKIKMHEHLLWYVGNPMPSIIDTSPRQARARERKYGY